MSRIKSETEIRVHGELIRAGLSRHALRKDETKYLHKVIHDDEHVMAAVNGRTDLGSVMLVATNKRVLYIDCKPFYTTVDELTYDVVSGVMHHVQGIFAQVVLHTRVGEYNLRFINPKQARQFVAYLESKRLTIPDPRTKDETRYGEVILPDRKTKIKFTKKEKQFLLTHQFGVLSTANRSGEVNGAAVYYLSDSEQNVYVFTKSDTQKARNTLSHAQAAFTIYDEFEVQTMQLQGIVIHEQNQKMLDKLVDEITKPKQFGDKVIEPPVTKLNAGSFVLLKFTPTSCRFSNYT